MNDPFGDAILDYFERGKAPDLVVNTNYTDDERIPVAHLFRNEKAMPELERTALKLCKGKILDVGAAAGCHSLLLQKKGYHITALEISAKASQVLKKRGIQKVVQENIYAFTGEKYDTILLLMNGAGIGKTKAGLGNLLLHLKSLLNDGGKILIDSTDIKYLFEEDDGSVWIDLNNNNYFGEMEYTVSYKKSILTFGWLFIDFHSLKEIARKVGLNCKLIAEGEHFDYLAELK